MSNYYLLKNLPLYRLPNDENLGRAEKQFGNIYLTGNVFVNNQVVLDNLTIRPRIHSIVYPNEARAARTDGGETIILRGNGFKANAAVKIANVQVSNASVISSTQINFVTPSKLNGNYLITVTNTDGGTATYIPGIDYSLVPTWVTPAGNRQTVYETQSIDTTLQINRQDIPNFFEITSGNLPVGVNLDINTGKVSGVAPIVTNSNVYSITAGIRDYQNQLVTRNFSFTVNPANITWSSPSPDTTYTQDVGSSFNLSLSASNPVNSPIIYSASNLPSGLSLSGNQISGTFPSAQTRIVTLTASAPAIQKTATRTINIVSQPPMTVSAVGSIQVAGIKNVYQPEITMASNLWFIPAAFGAQVGDLVFLVHWAHAGDFGVGQYTPGFNGLSDTYARANFAQIRIIQVVQWKILDSMDPIELARPTVGTRWQSYATQIYRPSRPITNAWIHGNANVNVYEDSGGDQLASNAECIQYLDSTALQNYTRFHIVAAHSEDNRTPQLQTSVPNFGSIQRQSTVFKGYWPTSNWPRTDAPPSGTYGYVNTTTPTSGDGAQFGISVFNKGTPGITQDVKSGVNARGYGIEYMQYSAVFVIS